MSAVARRRSWIWPMVAAVAFVAVVWVAPLVLVVLTAVKDSEQFARDGYAGLSGSPQQLLDNIATAAGLSDLWSGFTNSLLYGIVGSGVAVIFSATAAYSLVCLRVRYPFFLFMLIYAGTVLPLQLYMIPLNQAYKSTGIYDSQFGMLLFYVAICIPFCVFVFRGYFMGVAPELLEAARLDGASRTRIFRSIVAPLSLNPAVLLFLTQFLWIWNDLLFGQVLTSSSAARPIMPALAALSGNVQIATVPERMAGALLASVPALLLFMLLRKRFMQGFALHAN